MLITFSSEPKELFCSRILKKGEDIHLFLAGILVSVRKVFDIVEIKETK